MPPFATPRTALASLAAYLGADSVECASDEAGRDVLNLQVVLERAVVAAREDQQALGLVRDGVQLLAHRPRDLLVALRVKQQQRRVAAQRGHGLGGVEAGQPRLRGGVEREVR